jgi:glycerate 2-kinase
VRRQFDQVKGGGLAAAAAPAACVSLILSDVIGNDLAAIGSGPTFFSAERPQAAGEILHGTDWIPFCPPACGKN